ncbi:D-tyrosyl-tRNA(Tyr) deacylase [Lampropedia cohaerens]|uniref:D-aminoacyl-tRNA deacylase n=1 Tax=Lampropedia cohaerens TaxID=1610491 RepID=A0A0U1Q105_9BURK|nr:D-aminoacyl-tRNA deacylase [Lampropedia cohaerens]KKW68440.1 D-tyrosyl-tRNA(Tyr) deacylase [Lampropedia cohaerens]
MIGLVQRVCHAQVSVDARVVGAIDAGLLLFVCAEVGDTEREADRLLTKVLKLRIFSDDQGRMHYSVQDVQGGLLVVSQFTLAADVSGGNRPSFSHAAPPTQAKQLYDYFLRQARIRHGVVEAGEFAAHMQVALLNDGPVTIPLHIPPASPCIF